MSDRCMKSVPVSLNNPSIEKNQDLCADCGHCLAVCSEEIGVARQWADKSADAFSCIHCGQCAAVCPERAIRGKSHWREVVRAINDPQKIVVFSTAPSVRVGLGECFGGRPGDFVEGRMVSALRELGADYVLDVAFSADLTIMEEGTEFLRRFLTGSHPLPQFTSCCPAWVKYVETFHHRTAKGVTGYLHGQRHDYYGGRISGLYCGNGRRGNLVGACCIRAVVRLSANVSQP